MDFSDLENRYDLDPINLEEYKRNTITARNLIIASRNDRRKVSAGYFGRKYVDKFMSNDPELVAQANDNWMDEFGNDSVEIDVYDDNNGLYLFTCPSLVQIGDVGIASNHGLNLSEEIRKIEMDEGSFVVSRERRTNEVITAADRVIYTNNLRKIDRLFKQDIVVQYYGYPSFFTEEEQKKLFPRYALERLNRVVRNNPGLPDKAVIEMALEAPLILRQRPLAVKEPVMEVKNEDNSLKNKNEQTKIDESEFGW